MISKIIQNSPVITVDGPSGCGKGTLCQRLAKVLGWHWLDSGAIYRAIAWAIQQANIALDDIEQIKALIKRVRVDIQYDTVSDQFKVLCDGQEITQAIRLEQCGMIASKISTLAEVRQALLDYQRGFQRAPGLLTDGRDMGTVVFPSAALKIYLDADVEARVQRRYKQLQDQGINVSLRDIRQDLIQRDERDKRRAVAPTKPAADAVIIDTTQMSADQVFDKVMACVQELGL